MSLRLDLLYCAELQGGRMKALLGWLARTGFADRGLRIDAAPTAVSGGGGVNMPSAAADPLGGNAI